jgi:hypothetical protein
MKENRPDSTEGKATGKVERHGLSENKLSAFTISFYSTSVKTI